MSNFFTTFDLENGLFVGTLYETATNNIVYKTQPHRSQHQATIDINNFLVNKKPNTQPSNITPNPTPSISNVIHTNPPITTRRCCGR
jgi:hypothetical protein